MRTAMSISMDTPITSIQASTLMEKATAMNTSTRKWFTCMTIHTRTPMSMCTSTPMNILMQTIPTCTTTATPGSMAVMSMNIRRMRRNFMIIPIEKEVRLLTPGH